MSKSFKDKRVREIDNGDTVYHKKPNMSIMQKRQEKQIYNALRSRDLETLIKYSEEDLE